MRVVLECSCLGVLCLELFDYFSFACRVCPVFVFIVLLVWFGLVWFGLVCISLLSTS